MKHGPIALIDENMPVVFICTRDSAYEKVMSNMRRCGRARAASSPSPPRATTRSSSRADHVIYVPQHAADAAAAAVRGPAAAAGVPHGGAARLRRGSAAQPGEERHGRIVAARGPRNEVSRSTRPERPPPSAPTARRRSCASTAATAWSTPPARSRLDPETGELVGADVARADRAGAREPDGGARPAPASGSPTSSRRRSILVDMGDFQAMNEVYASHFTDSPPARTHRRRGRPAARRARRDRSGRRLASGTRPGDEPVA